MERTEELKRCTECGIEKPESSYGTERFRRDGSRLLKAKCKHCIARRAAARKSPRKLLDHRPRLREDGEWVKPCSDCHEEKPLREFNREGKRFAYPCRECVKVRRAEAYAADPKKELTRCRVYMNGLSPTERKNQRHKIYMKSRIANITRVMNRIAKRYGRFIEFVDFADVIARDGLVCRVCDGAVDIEDASPDHVVPYSRGGEHRVDNIQVTHKRCNEKKGNKLPSELRLLKK